MPAEGFAYSVRDNGEVVITHHGRQATVLRGERTARFLGEVESGPQGQMARWTGNYRRATTSASRVGTPATGGADATD